MNIRLALACTALGALAAGSAIAQDQAAYPLCDRANPSRTPQACDRDARARAYYAAHPDAAGYYQGYQYPAYAPPPAHYAPPAEAYGAPAAYEGAPPPGVAPVYVPAQRFWWERPGETSPGADYSVRLHGYVNPHTSVTAIPTPNNVSDQIPSHGPDFDGVPPYVPY